MVLKQADLQMTRDIVSGVIQRLPDDTLDSQHVLVSGAQWTYGLNSSKQSVGFYIRPAESPFKNTTLMPLRLAKRVQEFSGGTVVTVRDYLTDILRMLDRMINSAHN